MYICIIWRNRLYRGIPRRVYVSLKLITDKQVDQVVKKYEEIEPYLLKKLAQRMLAARAKAQSEVNWKNIFFY